MCDGFQAQMQCETGQNPDRNSSPSLQGSSCTVRCSCIPTSALMHRQGTTKRICKLLMAVPEANGLEEKGWVCWFHRFDVSSIVQDVTCEIRKGKDVSGEVVGR